MGEYDRVKSSVSKSGLLLAPWLDDRSKSADDSSRRNVRRSILRNLPDNSCIWPSCTSTFESKSVLKQHLQNEHNLDFQSLAQIELCANRLEIHLNEVKAESLRLHAMLDLLESKPKPNGENQSEASSNRSRKDFNPIDKPFEQNNDFQSRFPVSNIKPDEMGQYQMDGKSGHMNNQNFLSVAANLLSSAFGCSTNNQPVPNNDLKHRPSPDKNTTHLMPKSIQDYLFRGGSTENLQSWDKNRQNLLAASAFLNQNPAMFSAVTNSPRDCQVPNSGPNANNNLFNLPKQNGCLDGMSPQSANVNFFNQTLSANNGMPTHPIVSMPIPDTITPRKQPAISTANKNPLKSNTRTDFDTSIEDDSLNCDYSNSNKSFNLPANSEVSLTLNQRQYYRKNCIRPRYTYATLIRQALHESPNQQLTLNEIYNWFLSEFAFFRQNEATWKTNIFCLNYSTKLTLNYQGKSKSNVSTFGVFFYLNQQMFACNTPCTENAVRHNLSLHKCFKRIETVAGSVWIVDEPEYKRRKAKRGICYSGRNKGGSGNMETNQNNSTANSSPNQGEIANYFSNNDEQRSSNGSVGAASISCHESSHNKGDDEQSHSGSINLDSSVKLEEHIDSMPDEHDVDVMDYSYRDYPEDEPKFKPENTDKSS